MIITKNKHINNHTYTTHTNTHTHNATDVFMRSFLDRKT